MIPSADVAAVSPKPAAQRARRHPGVAWFAGVAVLVCALACSLAAPPIAGTVLRMALVRSFGTTDVAVSVDAHPAPAVWWGNIGMLSITARSLHAGRLPVADFDAVLTRVAVDAAQLYGRRDLVVRSVGYGLARITVTEDDLARLVADQPFVRRVAVHLRRGTVTLEGTVSVLGADFPASLSGHLVVHDATRLDLSVDRVTVLDGLPVPPDVASRLSASINPVLDVGHLPFGLSLTKVTIGDGVLMLQAQAGRPAVEGRTP